ncbi:hypothetical protein [Haloimpatiens massiliensis]|uniref:hypothetical protein n=1 Tax=Haloimpatiens massiliensis TaxID=1658110 RepID=UPI000C854DD4|nr:hypothetical protein [Haloimpatiens massiliensis]
MAQILYSNIDKFPKTKKFIENAVDTNKSYQIKKVEWVVQELMSERECVKWYKEYDESGFWGGNSRKLIYDRFDCKEVWCLESFKSKV